MYTYGELPSDLDQVEESLGPPPSWFRPEQGIVSPHQAYYGPYATYGGLGDVEREIEVNPVEQLHDLKFKQEMNKKIPKIANRYASIDPLSPLFRDKKAKYGYGGLGEIPPPRKTILVLITSLVAFKLFFAFGGDLVPALGPALDDLGEVALYLPIVLSIAVTYGYRKLTSKD